MTRRRRFRAAVVMIAALVGGGLLAVALGHPFVGRFLFYWGFGFAVFRVVHWRDEMEKRDGSETDQSR